MDGEAAGAAAEVEHGTALRVGLQAAPVFLLIEEVTGLLAVFDADEHSGVVLANFKFVRNGSEDAFFDLRETLLFADGDVVPLVDAPRLEKVSQDGNDLVLPALHAARDDLKREAVGKFVDGQAGQAV